jgi:hypothetical protein
VPVLPASGNNVPHRGARGSFAGRICESLCGRSSLCAVTEACVRSLTGVVANGAMLSKMAISLMGNLGFDDVADLIDGYQAWATR